MDTQHYKEVYFDKYCETCKHKDEDVTEDSVCEDCLSNPVNAASHKPVRWEAKEIKGEKL